MVSTNNEEDKGSENSVDEKIVTLGQGWNNNEVLIKQINMRTIVDKCHSI